MDVNSAVVVVMLTVACLVLVFGIDWWKRPVRKNPPHPGRVRSHRYVRRHKWRKR